MEDDQEKGPPPDPLVNLIRLVQPAEKIFQEPESGGEEDPPTHENGCTQRCSLCRVFIRIGEPVLIVDLASEPDDQRGTYRENDGPHLLVSF